VIYPAAARRWKSTVLVLGAVAAVVVGALIAHVSVFATTLHRITHGIDAVLFSTQGNSSVKEHLADITLGWHAAISHWLIGIGAFPAQLPGAAVSSNNVLYLHNDLLMMWLRYGLLGLLIFGSLLVASVRLGYLVISHYRTSASALGALWAACFPFIAVIGGIFAPYLSESRRWDGLFGVAVGCCLAALSSRSLEPARDITDEVSSPSGTKLGEREMVGV
jgi:O-antigen ligase